MADKTIKRAVRLHGRMFAPGNAQHAEELDQISTPDQIKSMKERELIEGDFEGQLGEDDEVPTRRTVEGAVRPKGVNRKYGEGEDAVTVEADSSEGTKLPTGFPARTALTSGGFDTVEKVTAASDEELEALEGVGEATVEKIREALSG